MSRPGVEDGSIDFSHPLGGKSGVLSGPRAEAAFHQWPSLPGPGRMLSLLGHRAPQKRSLEDGEHSDASDFLRTCSQDKAGGREGGG